MANSPDHHQLVGTAETGSVSGLIYTTSSVRDYRSTRDTDESAFTINAVAGESILVTVKESSTGAAAQGTAFVTFGYAFV